MSMNRMSMNTYANIAMTISESDIEKIAPVEFASFKELFDEQLIEADDDLAYDFEIGFEGTADDAVLEELTTRINALIDAVHEKTLMRPRFAYHENEEMDDIDGWYWSFDIDDVYQLSPSAKALKEQGISITMSGYTTFG